MRGKNLSADNKKDWTKESLPAWKEDIMKEKREEAGVCSRRRILTGSAMLLAGGIVGGMSNACSAPGPTSTAAPPLPWKWTKLDPLEAGRRAYRSYLKNKG
jgi:hypothetical protein